jgi:hypothetical protein
MILGMIFIIIFIAVFLSVVEVGVLVVGFVLLTTLFT